MKQKRILVIGRDRTRAEAEANSRGQGAKRIRRDRWEAPTYTIDVAIYGGDLSGRMFDEIVMIGAAKSTEAQRAYLIHRIAMGGRFIEVDDGKR